MVTMSAMGHKQTSRHVRFTSVLRLKADIHQRGLPVRLVPEPEVWCVDLRCGGGEGLSEVTRTPGRPP